MRTGEAGEVTGDADNNSEKLTLIYWRISIRMKCWNSTRCDIYRSVRNAIKLIKWQEMLRSEPLWGHFWRILCYEAGHKWTQPTLHCTCCAVCIGRHNCRHYNWLAAASVLGCLQNHKNNTSFSFAFAAENKTSEMLFCFEDKFKCSIFH